MADFTNELLSLCADDISKKLLEGDSVELVKFFIDRGFFKYISTANINNVDILKLMIEKEFIDKTKLKLKYTQNLCTIQYLIEELQMNIDREILLAIINTWNSIIDAKEKFQYLLSKIANLEELRKFVTDSCSLINKACYERKIEACRLLLQFYKNNTELRNDLSCDPYIKSVEIAKLIVEEFGYPYSMIGQGSTSRDVDQYLNTRPVKRLFQYFAVEFDNKQDIKLPEILEIDKNDKFYYGYKIIDNLTSEQLQKQINIMTGIGSAKVYYL